MLLQSIFQKIENYEFSGDFESDVEGILKSFGKEETFHHVMAVSTKALEIADYYDVDKDKVRIAALLHDFSAIIPPKYRLSAARELGVKEIKDDDIENPIMLHGKISAELARKYFGIKDEGVLNAMRYHTSLRKGASTIEQIVCIADKIALDRTTKHKAEYMEEVVAVVNEDVREACFFYLKWSVENLKKLGWQKHYTTVEAFEWLNSIYGDFS